MKKKNEKKLKEVIKLIEDGVFPIDSLYQDPDTTVAIEEKILDTVLSILQDMIE